MGTKLRIAALLALSMTAQTLHAQENSNPQTMLELLFEAPEIDSNWFAPNFLSQVPAAQVSTLINSMEEQYGSFESVDGEGERFTVRLERAEVPARLVLDAEGRIAGLLFEPPVASGDLSQQVEAITALPGRTAILVLSNGEAQAEHNADEPLAVGSAAKLAVLKAVREAVEAGQLRWEQVVPLDDSWRSLPTGILQDWPADTPVTIATLANLMISISDNTATDALVRIVGREAVEVVTPRNTPFPTTRELFILKASGNEILRQTWAEGDEAARRDILQRIDGMPLPEAGQLAAEPTTDVEWFLSARELCELMRELSDLPSLHINPGVAEAANWEAIAFKGGSETGILNFTTRLEGPDGTTHCVVATWNDPEAPIDNQSLTSSYRAILRALRDGG